MKEIPLEKYAIEKKRIHLIDRELHLSIDEPFDPPLLPKKRKNGHKVGDCLLHMEGEEVFLTKRGRREGQSLLFYPEGLLKGEAFYSKNELHGPSTFWGSEGVILSKCWFIHGKREGKCWHYDLLGTLSSLTRFRHGVPHGNQEYYYSSGQLKTVMPYSKGKLHGVVYLYFPDGQLKQSIAFRQGKRVEIKSA